MKFQAKSRKNNGFSKQIAYFACHISCANFKICSHFGFKICQILIKHHAQKRASNSKWFSESNFFGFWQASRSILDEFWDHAGVHPGSSWNPFSQFWDAKVTSFGNLFLQPLPERLEDHFWEEKVTKKHDFDRGWMCLKHSK